MNEIKTNMGSIPIEDYLEIMALQYGFESYENMKSEGYIIEISEYNRDKITC